MRVAVMSDIHGFSLALETILTDVEGQGPLDAVVVAGDLCAVGPAPRKVLDILRGRPESWIVLQGNTDRDLVQAATEGGGRGSTRYALDQIGDEGVAYLAGLSFSHRITPPGGASPDNDLLAVHANPRNLDDKFDPAMSDRELRETLGDARAGVVAFGHIHIAYTRRLDDILLADVSAVGNPKDGDLRCKYGLFTWDAEKRTWDVELRRLDYPVEETAAQIRASALPDPEKTLKNLLRASY